MTDQTDKSNISNETKKLSELTDSELLEKAKKMKSTSMMNAIFIGIMAGVIIYSIVKNNLGFFTLVPLYFAYKLIKSSKDNKPLEAELKARNLK
jgi:riboflavin transporter FmnP